MKIMQGVFLIFVCLLIVFFACRRNQPSLVETNQAPETELWYAPPDSTEYEYKVHLYWRGTDFDGTATRFIWVIKDTLVLGTEVWNPAERVRDFREGTITNRTDSVFSFTGFKLVGGAPQTRNRQAFHIAAIDDEGVIDPSPAAFEFVASIGKLPEIRFYTDIRGIFRPYEHNEVPRDTVGMFKPFTLSYNGVTTNGTITGYKYFPISSGLEVPGADVWSTVLTDTNRIFRNNIVQPGDNPDDGTIYGVIPSSIYRFAAQCLDEAGAESRVSPATFENGVAQIVVNYDPDTRIHEVRNSYSTGGQNFTRQIDFEDGVPDTVSYKSWLTLFYSGWDDQRDSIVCNPVNPDRCLDYQIRYILYSGSFREISWWFPRDATHDTDTLAVADSNSVSIGSFDYEWLIRTIDENGRGDGTPPSVAVVGNYPPTLDSVAIEDHFGNRMDLSVVDTLTWNFWKAEGWPDNDACWCDSVDFGTSGSCFDHPCPPGQGTFQHFKNFALHIKAWGHDEPEEPTGSGVKAWQYTIHDSDNNLLTIGESGAGWQNAAVTNRLDDVVRVRFEYPGPFTQPPEDIDWFGDTVFENLPSWFDKDLTVRLWGRDTLAQGQEGFYSQYLFLNGSRYTANDFAAGGIGRLTKRETFTFHVRLIRP